MSCFHQPANLRALHIAAQSARVSDRGMVSLASTCSSLRLDPRAPSLPRGHSPKQHRAPTRVGKQLLVSSCDPNVCLLGLEVMPQPQPLAAAYAELVQQLGQGKAPTADHYNKLMSDLCRCERFEQAWQLYSAAKQAGVSLRYNAVQRLVSLAIKMGDLRAAVEAFEDLKSMGLQPNKVTYCSLISALGKDRRRGVRSAQLAYELWGELQVQGERLDAAAYRIGMNACVGVGRLPEAQALLKSVAAAGEGQDVRAYNILLKAHSRGGDTPALARLLARMTTAGVRPSAVSYNILIDAYAREGAMEEARRAMERAVAAGALLDAWSYTSLVKGYVQSGELGAAEGVLRDMRAAGVRPNQVTYSTLVDGYVRGRDLGAALRTLEAMSAQGEAPNVVTYNMLLRGFAAADHAAGNSTATIITCDGRDDCGSGGSATVRAAAEAGAQAGSASGAAPALGLQQALALLDTMQARGVAPTTDTFNTLMAAAMAGGRPQLAVDVYARMAAMGLRPDAVTYTTLLQAYSRTDRVSEAMAVFEALRRDGNASLDVPACNAAVDVLSRGGEMEAAERMASAAARMAEKQGQPPPVEAYGALVTGYARLRLVAPALEAVRQYHAAGGTPDVRMLEALADVCVRQGEYKVAMQSVRALELLGHPPEKNKYKTLVMAAMKRAERVQRRRRGAGAGAGASYAGSSSDEEGAGAKAAAARRRAEAQASKPSVYLERFKFWLGLPNSYYNSPTDDEG